MNTKDISWTLHQEGWACLSTTDHALEVTEFGPGSLRSRRQGPSIRGRAIPRPRAELALTPTAITFPFDRIVQEKGDILLLFLAHTLRRSPDIGLSAVVRPEVDIISETNRSPHGKGSSLDAAPSNTVVRRSEDGRRGKRKRLLPKLPTAGPEAREVLREVDEVSTSAFPSAVEFTTREHQIQQAFVIFCSSCCLTRLSWTATAEQ